MTGTNLDLLTVECLKNTNLFSPTNRPKSMEHYGHAFVSKLRDHPHRYLETHMGFHERIDDHQPDLKL